MGKYLTVDEQATYIDVSCDGYVVRVHSDGSDAYLGEILDPNNLSTAWQRFGSKVDVGGTIYALSEDTGIAVTLIENTPMRVVIKAAGDFETSAQASLSNESGSELWLFIYPDKIVQHVIFNATGSITLADSTDNGMCFMDSVTANIANEDSKYEYFWSETDAGSDGEQNDADYIATLSDEINVTGILIASSLGGGTATLGQYIDDPGVAIRFEWNDGTITAASTMTVIWSIDSADRENDGGTFLDWDTDIDTNAVTVGTICEQSSNNWRYLCHTAHTAGAGNEPPNASYWHEYRMTLANQYKDLVMVSPTTGSEVTDLVIPADLSSDGFAADGARHTEMAAEELIYTNDIARIGHVDVIHDPMITTDGSTDLLLFYDKMDSVVNGHSPEVGSGTVTVGGTPTTVSGVRGDGVDFSSSSDIFTINSSGNIDQHEGTVIFDFIPNYDNTPSVDTYFFNAEGNPAFFAGYRSDDYGRITLNYAGTEIQMHDMENYFIAGQVMHFHFSWYWDGTNSYRFFFLNGRQHPVDTPANKIDSNEQTSLDTTFRIGNWSSAIRDLDGILDNFKILDGCLLPYGAYFTGNGAVDTDVAHADITFLWQGADATPIGTDVTNDGGDYVTDGPIGTKAFDNSDAGDNASAATSGNISAAEGSLSFWFKPNAALGADCTLFYADAAFKIWWDDSDNDVVFTYNTDVLNMTTAFAAGDTNWHHVCCQWKASDSLYIIVDGAVTSLLTGVDAAPTLDATMYFTADDADGTNRADVLMSDFFITDKMATPQIPVVLGAGPIYAPIREIS